jgi:acyl carrier protein
VNDFRDLVALLHDEMGLHVTEDHARLRLDQIDGWDSVHLLSLLTLLERRTGRSLSLAAVLEAGSLHDIYTLAVPG